MRALTWPKTAASILLALLLAPPAGGGDATGDGGRWHTVNRAINREVSAARRVAPELGVHVVEIESGDSIYSFRADTLRILASNTKLLTSAAALDRLGPGHFFETEVLIRGEPRGGVLDGDLAVVGGGDPNLSGRFYNGDSFGAFREWAAALEARGVRRVTGDLYLVTGMFDDQYVHPDWPRDQLTRWYEAPVAALSFNDNCVLVKVSPDGGPGRPAEVETVPPLELFDVRSSALTTSRRRDHWLNIDRRTAPGEEHVLTVRGRIHRGAGSVDKWIAVADPIVYFAAALRRALAEAGIAVGGRTFEAERLPDGGWRRVTMHRNDLLTTLEIVNKRSQNFYAECVLKLLGARLCGAGTWPEGVDAVTDFLTALGFEEGSYRLADGSGMSRGNRMTPRQLTRLLRAMYFHPRGDEFLRTLPYSGEPGLRWERRLARAPYRGNVFAKTGSLSGVSTLSGYAKARSGRLYAFSLLLNQARGQNPARAAQDRIVKAIIDHG